MSIVDTLKEDHGIRRLLLASLTLESEYIFTDGGSIARWRRVRRR